MGYDWFDTEVKPKLFPVIIHSIRVWISDLYNICPLIANTETQKLSPGQARKCWARLGAWLTLDLGIADTRQQLQSYIL